MSVSHRLLRAAAALGWAASAAVPAHADWVLPAGASASLGGGTAQLGCASLSNGGTLQLQGGALRSAANVTVEAGGTFTIDSGTVELAQLWTNNGTATATTGSVTRTASTGCPVAGNPGPVTLQPITTPQTLPLPGAFGTAQLTISGYNGATLPQGCQLDSASHTGAVPPGAPGQAPLGALTFRASGCTGATLAISITYPPGSLAGLTPRKYGPYTVGNTPRTGWFPPPNAHVQGDTVTYTVTDGGDGDGNAAAGFIDDPMAPLALAAAPGAAAGIPTLQGWALLLLSALAAALGLQRLPRPQRTHRPTRPHS